MKKENIIIALLALVCMAGQAQVRMSNRTYTPDPAPVVSGEIGRGWKIARK